jgi:hypothetical protein
VKILNKKINKSFHLLLISITPLLCAVAHADDQPATNFNQATISIIIDDMGYQLKSGNRAINLPGEITFSFLPHAPHVNLLSELAHNKSKEIMLHLPMEAEDGSHLGPGGLTHGMSEKTFKKIMESNLAAVPYASGFNNHMGSLLTKSQLWMTRLMHKVAIDKHLFFVDSKTTIHSVALSSAREEGINSISRDIFIDHEMSREFIEMQLEKIIQKAKQKGTALAIAHPKKLTLSILEKWLPKLEARGIKLVSVSKLIGMQQQRRLALWKAPVLNNAGTKLQRVRN